MAKAISASPDLHPAGATPRRRDRTIFAFSIVALLIAAALRIAGMNCQLWLDEIWSIRLAQEMAPSAWDVFFLHHDNNHYLNTLYVRWLGPDLAFWKYHVLSVVCGVGTVLFGYLIARRRGPWEGFAAAVLLGGAEFLIEFSTDARGYASAGFFAVLCLFLWESYQLKPRVITGILFAISAILGTLSHLSFLVVLIGFLASSAITWRPRPAMVKIGKDILLLYAAPLLVPLFLYLADIRYMIRGGGPSTPDDLPTQAAAMILGIELSNSTLAAIVGTCALGACAMKAWMLFRRRDAAWPLFATLVFFVPAFLFFWPRDDFLHPRYVYVAVPFLFLLLAMILGRWIAAGGLRRIAAIVALLAFCVVNASRTATFLKLGRGDYRGAVAYLMAHTPSGAVVIGCDDHPKSTDMVLDYYARGFPAGSRLMFMKGLQWGDQWPQWIVADHNDAMTLTNGNVVFVRRVKFGRGAVASGLDWVIYEAVPGKSKVRPDAVVPGSSR